MANDLLLSAEVIIVFLQKNISLQILVLILSNINKKCLDFILVNLFKSIMYAESISAWSNQGLDICLVSILNQ